MQHCTDCNVLQKMCLHIETYSIPGIDFVCVCECCESFIIFHRIIALTAPPLS